MSDLTTAEKIDAIENSEFFLAFDDCHKIYVLADASEGAEAASNGYTIRDASEIRECILASCGLVFVHPWNLDDDAPLKKWDIEQCTEDIFEAAGA